MTSIIHSEFSRTNSAKLIRTSSFTFDIYSSSINSSVSSGITIVN